MYKRVTRTNVAVLQSIQAMKQIRAEQRPITQQKTEAVLRLLRSM